MKLKLSTLTLILSSLLPLDHSFAMGKKPNVEQTLIINMKESAEQAQAAQQALVALELTMNGKLREVEASLQDNQFEKALSEARAVLDLVRTKIGIDPKARRQERFLVGMTFPNDSSRMSHLDMQQRDLIIRVVQDFRGGLYLDLINLSKRSALLYAKALKGVFMKNGGLTKQDINKIADDLANAFIYPILIEDLNGHVIGAIDLDIVNLDHVYMFDREIEMFVAQELGLSEHGSDSWDKAKNRALGHLISKVHDLNGPPFRLEPLPRPVGD